MDVRARRAAVTSAGQGTVDRWSAARWVTLGVLVTVVARLPTLGLPLDPDEGGYAYVARAWASGARLYDDAWVDRPQGLVLAFRLVDALGYRPLTLRLAAMVAAVVLTVSAGAVAWLLAGRRAGVVAGLAVAVVGSSPWIEGYQLNGELLAAAVGTAGLALGLAARRDWQRAHLAVRTDRGWPVAERAGEPAPRLAATVLLVAAGVLAAAAALVKQSALDTAVVLLVLASLGGAGWRRFALPRVVAGLALPVAAALAHAASTGWDRWWSAVVAFQASLGSGLTTGDRLAAVATNLGLVAPAVAGLVLAAVLAAVLPLALPGRGDGTASAAESVSGARAVALLWAAVALVPVLAGPFAHPHYWVQALAPLAVLGGVLAAPLDRRALAGLAALAVVVPVAGQVWLTLQSLAARTAAVETDPRQRANGDIAAWLRAHTRPDEQVYAFAASAELYLLAGRQTSYPYLWLAPVQQVSDALPRLAAYLGTPATAPRYVVVYQRPDTVDPTGRLDAVLARDYRQVAVVDGFPVLAHR